MVEVCFEHRGLVLCFDADCRPGRWVCFTPESGGGMLYKCAPTRRAAELLAALGHCCVRPGKPRALGPCKHLEGRGG